MKQLYCFLLPFVIIVILIATTIMFIISGCSKKSDNTTESKTDVISYSIFNTSWLLQSIDLGGGNILTVPSGQQYTLTFSDSTKATGFNYCNTYHITYRATSDGTISVQGYSSTKIYCSTAPYDTTFQIGLENSSNFEVINSLQLKIYYANKAKVLYFIKQQ